MAYLIRFFLYASGLLHMVHNRMIKLSTWKGPRNNNPYKKNNTISVSLEVLENNESCSQIFLG